MTKILNKTKPISEQILQKEIIFDWIKKNVQKTTLNYRIKLKDIYKKFITDTKINKDIISSGSFGMVFSNILEDLNMLSGKGQNGYYYGIYIEGVKGTTTIIDTSKKLDEKNRKFDFNIINEKNLKLWIENCLIIYTTNDNKHLVNNFISTNELFNNYCQYFGFNIRNTVPNRILFGRELAKLIKKYPLQYNLKRIKSTISGRSGYLNIKELKQITSPKLTLSTNYKSGENILPATKPTKMYKYIILVGISLINLGLLGWTLLNN